MAKNEETLVEYTLSRARVLKRRIAMLLPLLSLLVVLGIFWWLKLTGITMAGEAFCGIPEHVHGDECVTSVLICDENDYTTAENAVSTESA